jgi:hypothetical protein
MFSPFTIGNVLSSVAAAAWPGDTIDVIWNVAKLDRGNRAKCCHQTAALHGMSTGILVPQSRLGHGWLWAAGGLRLLSSRSAGVNSRVSR